MFAFKNKVVRVLSYWCATSDVKLHKAACRKLLTWPIITRQQLSVDPVVDVGHTLLTTLYYLLPQQSDFAFHCCCFCCCCTCRQHLSVEPVDEGRSLLHYLLPQHCEHQLTTFLSELEQQSRALGISDLQCSLASLEEVFLNIAKQVRDELTTVSWMLHSGVM